MKIIGIAGTNGSGKDTLSEMLAKDYGWLFVSSSRDLIIPELKRLGLPLERGQMSALSAKWRREDPGGAVVKRAVQKYQQANLDHQYNGLVISSLRHPWEVDSVHELGGKVVWVDAEPKVRYDRIFNRGQGDKDMKTFEQFLAEEQAEMNHSGDEATLNMAAVKAKADIFLSNDTDDIEEFKTAAQKALKSIL
ncbi:MAG TPA: AAA family ATPase [Candidatus Saccharimonadales bacterium]|nr:AAA family ATPase [Candidatus Saccharimonadales bacterium]